ncbi:hypothetical protein NAI35_12655, partial [Francisella tularensis subsp. holarctica]
NKLMELIEIPQHKWYIACQSHPEFTSTPRYGHKLFESYIQSAIENSNNKSIQLIIHE